MERTTSQRIVYHLLKSTPHTHISYHGTDSFIQLAVAYVCFVLKNNVSLTQYNLYSI